MNRLETIELPLYMWEPGNKEQLKEAMVKQIFFLLATWVRTAGNNKTPLNDQDLIYLLKSMEESWEANREAFKELSRGRY